MQQYDDVMKDPMMLQPYRALDNKIIWKEKASPVSVRPYRYTQVQKDEIERLGGEILGASIIQPSHIHFPALFSWLKKKKRWKLAVLHGLPSS